MSGEIRDVIPWSVLPVSGHTMDSMALHAVAGESQFDCNQFLLLKHQAGNDIDGNYLVPHLQVTSFKVMRNMVTSFMTDGPHERLILEQIRIHHSITVAKNALLIILRLIFEGSDSEK